MVGIFKAVNGMFDEALKEIQAGLFNSGAAIFDNAFFNVAFYLSICYIGFLLMFQKMKTEDSAYKLIWLIIIFTIVKGILAQQSIYVFFMQIINAPANALLQMITSFVTSINGNASIENIFESVLTSLNDTHNIIYAQAGWNNLMAYVYAAALYFCGTFLLVAILLFSVFSIFLAKTVLALSPFVIIFLLWRKTEYIFFNWLRLYVSLSLYAPMTILFGLVCIKVAEHMKKVSTGLAEGGFSDVIGVCVALILISLAIFKIPNIINQVIGSSNEGSSLSSGMGTLSAGAAIVGTVAKASGAKFVGESAGKGMGSLLGKGMDRGLDSIKEKWFGK
jgi:type IV secretion system protein VirB6